MCVILITINLEINKLVRILYKNYIMAYKRQLQTALDRLDQGLARVHSMVKRGKNADAIHFMENDLKELYDELQNIITITPENDQSRVGFLE